MSRSDSFILKLVVKIIVFVLLLLMVGSLSKLYSYFRTGADRADTFNSTYQKRFTHEPSFQWNKNKRNKGVVLDQYTQAEIQKAYASAWYLINKSIAENKDMGLTDHVSDKMIEKISRSFKKSKNLKVQSVDLTHHLDLHLFSIDRQLISFTDNDVQIFRKTKDAQTGYSGTYLDTCHFDVVMGLEDGYWKLLEMVEIENGTLPAQLENQIVAKSKKINQNFISKGINYYPSEFPWFDFWRSYDPKLVRNDLKQVKKLGFNCVRIFVPYRLFGGSEIDDKMINHLDDFIDQLSRYQLKAIITLFDFPETYALDGYPESIQHAQAIVEHFKNNENIFAWDIKNEPDLDFVHHGKEVVMDWLGFMTDFVKTIDPNHMVTIGWSRAEYGALLADKMDLISLHSYRSIEKEEKAILALQKKVKNKPFLISEFGRTSYRSNVIPFGSTENEQAVYAQEMLLLMQKLNIDHYAYWTLYDFVKAPSEVFGRKPWIKKAQENMGVLSINGKPKMCAQVFKTDAKTDFKLTVSDHFKPFYILAILSFVVFLGILKILWNIIEEKRARKTQVVKDNGSSKLGVD